MKYQHFMTPIAKKLGTIMNDTKRLVSAKLP